MPRNRVLPILLLASALVVACDDATAPVQGPEPDLASSLLIGDVDCDPLRAVLECDEPIGGGGWSFFGSTDDALRSAPGDPNPSAAGIWLGSNTTDLACFAATGRTINDKDKDWLDDGCEYRIARAFAPTMLFYIASPCPAGEPYWAAKYFPKPGVVRIAYMPAYYEDCGVQNISPSVTSHTGDSEYVYVEVSFNRTTRHWQFDRMWLSAHYGTGEADRSELVGYADTHFSKKNRSHPRIWVASSKHANYKSVAACRQSYERWYFLGIDFHDLCHESGNYPIRFPVYTTNNVGSRFVGTQCVSSRDKYPEYSGYECFYHEWGKFGYFRGWQEDSHGTPPPAYYAYLMSSKFEERYGDWGPGPEPPTLTATIGGPSTVEEYTRRTWTATVSQGYAPYTYRWSVNGSYRTTSSTLTAWAGARGSQLQIELEVTDSKGARVTDFLTVHVAGPDGEIDTGVW